MKDISKTFEVDKEENKLSALNDMLKNKEFLLNAQDEEDLAIFMKKLQ